MLTVIAIMKPLPSYLIYTRWQGVDLIPKSDVALTAFGTQRSRPCRAPSWRVREGSFKRFWHKKKIVFRS